jgi:hypothetical protein
VEAVVSLPEVPSGKPRSIAVIGETASLTGRWLFDEAAARLEELGIPVKHMAIDRLAAISDVDGPTLILDDGRPSFVDFMTSFAPKHKSVLFSEFGRSAEAFAESTSEVTDDFVTAIYWAAWNSF